MLLQKLKSSGVRIPRIPKYKSLLPTTDGLITICYNSKLKISVNNEIITLGGTRVGSLINSLKALCLNITVSEVLMPAHFWVGLIKEVAKVCETESKPASYMKEIFFQAEVAARRTVYPQSGSWTRYPRVVRGVDNHRRIQRKLNIPISPFQYYIIELCVNYRDHLITIFRSFELIEQDLSYSYATMTEPYKGSHSILRKFGRKVPLLLKTMGVDKVVDPMSNTVVYGSYQSGPNSSPAITSHMKDLKALKSDTELYKDLSNLLNLTNAKVANILLPLEYDESLSSIGTEVTKPKGRVKDPCHSKVIYIPDGKFGKTRQIAICDMISQSAMTGYNYEMMSILRRNSEFDATFNQDVLPHYLQYHTGSSDNTSSLPCSADSTAFTDRLPRILNYLVVKGIFGKMRAKSWFKVMFNRTFTMSPSAIKNGTPNKLKYSVGSPMGLLTSWSSSALVHHLIVRFAHVQLKKRFRYIILGDDVCIWDRSVYKFYTDFMRKVGIDISAIKSTDNTKFVEFAKRTFILITHNNAPYIKEVTGLPATAAYNICRGDVSGITGYLGQVANRSCEIEVKNLNFNPQCWNQYSNDVFVASKVCNLLTYLIVNRHSAYKGVISYLFTWPFQGRGKFLLPTIYVNTIVRQMGVHNAFLANIISENCISPGDFLRQHEFLALSKPQLNGIFQVIMLDDMKKEIDKATKLIEELYNGVSSESFSDIVKLVQIANLSCLTKTLSKTVLDFLFSDIDMMNDDAIKLLFDCKVLDLISRVEQISTLSSIKRRDLIMIRNSRLGEETCTVLKRLSVQTLIDKYKFLDFMSEYSNLSDKIDRKIRSFALQKTWLDYLSALN